MLRSPRPFGLVPVLALAFLAHSVRAERLFVGILEADSYQSVLYGASAFSRIADLPIALDMVSTALTKNLAIPSFAGVSSSETLRVVQSVDTSLPLGDNNPANVAIIPLTDTGQAMRGLFASAYALVSEKSAFTRYENPSNTNLAPRVAVAVSGHHLLASTSEEALAWAWANRSQLIDAPAQSIPGTLRVLVNPQRLADLLGSRSEKTASVFNLDKLLRDFESFSFSLTLDGQALALTARGQPKANTPLHALAAALRKPREPLWNALPDSAFFASLSACDRPTLWDPYLGEARFRLLHPVADLVPPETFGGDRLMYLAPTRDRKGLCFVQIEPVTNAAAVREAVQKLETVKKNDGVFLKREAPRLSNRTQIETYSLTLRHPEPAAGAQPSEPSTLFTLMSLFLRQAVLEAAVAEGHLVTVLGPAHSIDSELESLGFPEKALTLRRKISGQDPALSDNLQLGSSVHIAGLVRHIVTIMPGVKPEHLRVLPVGGDGATFGISQSENRTLTASLRFQSNEIAALQRINKDGREVLQELFFQMFSSQLLNLQQPAAEKPTAP